MIYLDTSVALAQLFAEDRLPPVDLWLKPLTSSRLLQYEVWNRLNARRLEPTHGDAVRELLNGYVANKSLLENIDDYIVPPGLGNQSGSLGAIALAMQLEERVKDSRV